MHQRQIQHLEQGEQIMARITVTIPNNIHSQVLKIADKENESISYTVSRLTEIGLMVLSSNKDKKNEFTVNEIDEHCQKLIIQMNGILKEIAIDKFNFNDEKIEKITNATLTKFNQLKRNNKNPSSD